MDPRVSVRMRSLTALMVNEGRVGKRAAYVRTSELDSAINSAAPMPLSDTSAITSPNFCWVSGMKS